MSVLGQQSHAHNGMFQTPLQTWQAVLSTVMVKSPSHHDSPPYKTQVWPQILKERFRQPVPAGGGMSAGTRFTLEDHCFTAGMYGL